MMTQRDPHTNILRATLAVFGAATGGADAITVLPFTAACGMPDRFARRVARNNQLVLADEAFLGKVADPGAGSGTIETLTDQLCGAAWSLFQEIEAAGGAAAALAATSSRAKSRRCAKARRGGRPAQGCASSGRVCFRILAKPNRRLNAHSSRDRT